MGKSKQCLQVGVLINELTGYFNRELIDSLCKKAEVEGIKLLFIAGRHLNDATSLDRQFNLAFAFGHSQKLDAIICASAYIEGNVGLDELFGFVKSYSHLPVISLNHAIPGCASVVIDNGAGFNALLHHLIHSHAYTRIAFMKGPDGTPDADARFDIYTSCLARAGLTFDPHLVVQGQFSHLGGRIAMEQLLDRKLPFDVLVCANDSMAQAAISIALERGFRIPQDFAVTGFDDILSFAHKGVPLTTVNQSLQLLATSAIDALLAYLRGAPLGAVITLPTRAVIRMSCGCVTNIHIAQAEFDGEHNTCDRRERLIADLRLLPDQVEQFDVYIRQLEHCLEHDSDKFQDHLSLIAHDCFRKFGDISRLQTILLFMYRALFNSRDKSVECLQSFGEILLKSQIVLFNAQSVIYSSEKSMDDASEQQYREIDFFKRHLFDFRHDHIMDVVELAMHEFRIPSAYIVLYSEPIVFISLASFALPESSHLVFSMAGYVRQTEELNVPFSTLDILPGQLFADGEHQVLTLLPIFQHSDHYGYMVFDLTVMPSCRIESIRSEISTALINSILFSKIQKLLDRNVIMQDELVQIEKMAALGRLVAGMAHELNTPIGSALLGASSLRQQTQEFGDAVRQGSIKRSAVERFGEQCVDVSLLVERNLVRAAELINNFKMVAVDQTTEHLREFDLSETIAQVMTTLENLIRHRPIHVHMNIPRGISMYSYPGSIAQLIINFFTNALTHAFPNNAPGEIWISCNAKNDDAAVIVFRDNGIGIAPEHLNKIFDPFFTTRLGLGGCGLGLSIVENIARGILGGKLAVESTLGLGTTFTVSIPKVATMA